MEIAQSVQQIDGNLSWLLGIKFQWALACNFLCGHVFISFGSIPKSEIAKSFGNYV